MYDPSKGHKERMADPKYAAYIQRIVDAAGPLSDKDIEVLRRLLPPPRDRR